MNFFPHCDLQEKQVVLPHKNCNLIVYHVLWSSTELLIAFDHLVDCLQEVLLSDSFPTGSNCIHTCLGTHTTNIGTCTFNMHYTLVKAITITIYVTAFPQGSGKWNGLHWPHSWNLMSPTGNLYNQRR